MRHNVQSDPQNPPGNIEKDALLCVKADEPSSAVWLHHQKNDCRDDRNVCQHPGYIIGKSRTGIGDKRCGGGHGRCPAAAGWAYGRTIGNLCATHIAKRHGSLLPFCWWPREYVRATLRQSNRKRPVKQSRFWPYVSLNCGRQLIGKITYER